jgi:hypothetical protein
VSPAEKKQYDRFRTGLTYQDVWQMLWSPDPDPKNWRRKSKGVVLSLWRQLKEDMWAERCRREDAGELPAEEIANDNYRTAKQRRREKAMKDAIDTIINEARARLQRTALHRRACGLGNVVFDSSVEENKRSRRRVLSVLVDQAWLRADSGAPDAYTITDAVFDSIESAAPMLAGRRIRESDSVWWSSLTLAEQKWVLTHPDDYRAKWRSTGASGSEHPCALGSKRPDALYHHDLAISNGATEAALAAELRDRTIGSLFRVNVGWALVTVAKVAKSDAEGWAMKRDAGDDPGAAFLGSCLSKTLGHTEATWEEDAKKILADAEERFEKAKQELLSVRRVTAKVQKAGGWSALAKELRERVTAHVDKPAESEAPAPAEVAS